MNSLAGSVGIPDAVEQGRQAEWAARGMLELVTALPCWGVGKGTLGKHGNAVSAECESWGQCEAGYGESPLLVWSAAKLPLQP